MFTFLNRCGFFRINGESVVPYTMKEGVKYVPLFYFEGETDHLKLKSDKVDGWDLAYLKFCCKVQVRMHCGITSSHEICIGIEYHYEALCSDF